MLSASEVVGFLNAVKATRNPIALMPLTRWAYTPRDAYAGDEIDISRMSIRIEPGGGGEGRHELPSPQLLATLRVSSCLTKAGQWLFARRNARGIRPDTEDAYVDEGPEACIWAVTTSTIGQRSEAIAVTSSVGLWRNRSIALKTLLKTSCLEYSPLDNC